MSRRKKEPIKTDEELSELLTTWRTAVLGMTTVSEADALRCINLELRGQRRKDILARLYGRFGRLRSEREMSEITEAASRGRAWNP